MVKVETQTFMQLMLSHHDATCPFGECCGVRTLHALSASSIDTTKEEPCPTSP